MFEILAVIGSVLLSVMAILQFRRSYLNRKTLKDLSLLAWIVGLFACLCLTIRFVEIKEWAMTIMEVILCVINIFTVCWIVKANKK